MNIYCKECKAELEVFSDENGRVEVSGCCEAAELTRIRADRDEAVKKNQLLMAACGKAARHIIELHNGVETMLTSEAVIDILDEAILRTP